MHAAPPAACLLAHGGLWRLVHLGLPAAGVAALVWAATSALPVWQLPTTFGTALAAAGMADLFWRRRALSMLAWNGAHWLLGSQGGGQASLLWDGGRWLLVRWQDGQGGATRWLMLDRADAASAAAWHALRVALVQQAQASRRLATASRAEAA